MCLILLSMFSVSEIILAEGEEVRVLGANLHPPGVRGLFCQFAGAEVVQASYDGEEALRCVTPPATRSPRRLALRPRALSLSTSSTGWRLCADTPPPRAWM